jgi:hypothetical protein
MKYLLWFGGAIVVVFVLLSIGNFIDIWYQKRFLDSTQEKDEDDSL